MRRLLLILTFALAALATPESLAAQAERTGVVASATLLRDTASLAGNSLGSVAAGTEVDILAEEGSFYRVRLRGTGQEGYLSRLLVNASAPAPAPAPTTSAPPTPPAAPQAPTPAPVQPSPAPAAPSVSDAVDPGARSYSVRPFAGLFKVASSSGFRAGVGAVSRPLNSQQVEVQVDGSWIRIEGIDGADLSASVLFNIRPAGVTPFVGGGPTVFATRTSREFAVQVIGGVQIPVAPRRAFRGEVRLGFFEGDTAVSVLGGLSF